MLIPVPISPFNFPVDSMPSAVCLPPLCVYSLLLCLLSFGDVF